MAPGSAGPSHALSTEQVVVVVSGRLRVALDGEERLLEAGDSVALAAGAERRFSNGGDSPVITVTAAFSGATARVGDGPPAPIPWAA